jgi:hypothetical protein
MHPDRPISLLQRTAQLPPLVTLFDRAMLDQTAVIIVINGL